ncbi:MAG: hypothetical protein ACPHXR_00240 [Flavicella sp.]
MHKKIEEYIENNLANIAILEEENVSYEGVKIREFKTHHESGDVFKHQNDKLYAIAILHAITKSSAQKISKELKKNKNLNHSNFKELVEKQFLKCYISGDSEAYDTWKKGDEGLAYLQYDDTKKTVIPAFTNTSAESRKNKEL